MANYNGKARTNYFKVKDETAFRAWAGKHSLDDIYEQAAAKFGIQPTQATY